MGFLTTKKEVDNQLGLSSDELSKLEKKYDISFLKQEFEKQIAAVQTNEKIFLRALNANSIEEVNNRLREIQRIMPSIKNLNGSLLTEKFLEPAKRTYEAKINKDQQDFVNFMTQEAGYKNSFPSTQEFQEWFQGVLNNIQINGKTGKVHGVSGYANATSLEQVVLRKLSSAQKKRVKEYIKLKRSGRKIKKYSVQLNSESVIVTQTSQDWSSLTLSLKQKEVEEMMASGEMTIADMNQILSNIENLILSKVEDNVFFKSAVHEILWQKDSLTKIFYGGNIVNGVTGILGEIQGLFYMKALLNNAGTGATVSWVGGIGNPHEDLIIFYNQQATGIQIKNSTKDLDKIKKLENVSFLSRQANNFDFIRSKLGESYEDLLKIYEMYAFNIEYQKEGNKYIAAPNEEFAGSRDKIRELRQRVDRVMAIFATSLMYMAAIESTEGISTGNSVYLLGGTIFQLASEILTKLFAQLQANERPSLKVTSHFNKGATETGNIVDYFNYNIKKHGTSKRKTLGTLFLQSSYTFTL